MLCIPSTLGDDANSLGLIEAAYIGLDGELCGPTVPTLTGNGRGELNPLKLPKPLLDEVGKVPGLIGGVSNSDLTGETGSCTELLGDLSDSALPGDVKIRAAVCRKAPEEGNAGRATPCRVCPWRVLVEVMICEFERASLPEVAT